MKKHITVLVSNDLEHDQRVAKVCNTLHTMGFDITLVGRLFPGSKSLNRPYVTHRFNLIFRRGMLFYAALNVRLFFYLLFKKTDILLANDLDTLLPAFLVSRIRGKAMVYDSHEYFTGAEGLTGRKFPTWIWTKMEEWIFPKLKHVYTVNESIASIYRNKYKVHVDVVRNVPPLRNQTGLKSRGELGLPSDRKIILLQGAYIDPDRGAVEAVLAQQHLDNCLLLIIGSGGAMNEIRELVKHPAYKDKVRVLDKMSFEELSQFTRNSDLGLTLDKPVHLNYLYSLPNKLFDYIHAGIPVLVSDLPEMRRIFERYEIGKISYSFEPGVLAQSMKEALDSPDRETWKANLERARKEYNWDEEEKILKKIYSPLL